MEVAFPATRQPSQDSLSNLDDHDGARDGPLSPNSTDCTASAVNAKRQARRQKNRESARRVRARKFEELKELHDKVSELTNRLAADGVTIRDRNEEIGLLKSDMLQLRLLLQEARTENFALRIAWQDAKRENDMLRSSDRNAAAYHHFASALLAPGESLVSALRGASPVDVVGPRNALPGAVPSDVLAQHQIQRRYMEQGALTTDWAPQDPNLCDFLESGAVFT